MYMYKYIILFTTNNFKVKQSKCNSSFFSVPLGERNYFPFDICIWDAQLIINDSSPRLDDDPISKTVNRSAKSFFFVFILFWISTISVSSWRTLLNTFLYSKLHTRTRALT